MNAAQHDNPDMNHDTPITFLDFLKLAAAWLLNAVCHTFDADVLQRISFVLAIIYTGIQIYVFWRDKMRRSGRRIDP